MYIVFANILLLEEPEFTLIPLPRTTHIPVQPRLFLPTDIQQPMILNLSTWREQQQIIDSVAVTNIVRPKTCTTRVLEMISRLERNHWPIRYFGGLNSLIY